jgi:hypothetical protein
MDMDTTWVCVVSEINSLHQALLAGIAADFRIGKILCQAYVTSSSSSVFDFDKGQELVSSVALKDIIIDLKRQTYT